MKITPVKTPAVAKKLFPNYLWNVQTEKKELYLTFDDGPTPEVTKWVLQTLDQFEAKATFFCIGSNIAKHSELFQTIVAQGHAIGNHTQNHLKGWKTKTKTYLNDVFLAEKEIAEYLEPSKLFRPPYGKLKTKQGKALLQEGYQIVMWDILSFDWQADLDQEDCLQNVISKSKEGSIIVFHDSIKASKNLKYALPKTLEYFSNLGYEFKALTV
ncbi:MAG: polysaccharide deacetylase family protein [Psychroserpens sp.]|nr:polysaccharide deacetylase family protein [Psychroserpens sp.]